MPTTHGEVGNALAVTPNDTVDIAGLPTTAEGTRALLIGGAGNVTVDMVGVGTNILLTGLSAGQLLPIRVTRVYLTGTTATAIVAFY